MGKGDTDSAWMPHPATPSAGEPPSVYSPQKTKGVVASSPLDVFSRWSDLSQDLSGWIAGLAVSSSSTARGAGGHRQDRGGVSKASSSSAVPFHAGRGIARQCRASERLSCEGIICMQPPPGGPATAAAAVDERKRSRCHLTSSSISDTSPIFLRGRHGAESSSSAHPSGHHDLRGDDDASSARSSRRPHDADRGAPRLDTAAAFLCGVFPVIVDDNTSASHATTAATLPPPTASNPPPRLYALLSNDDHSLETGRKLSVVYGGKAEMFNAGLSQRAEWLEETAGWFEANSGELLSSGALSDPDVGTLHTRLCAAMASEAFWTTTQHVAIPQTCAAFHWDAGTARVGVLFLPKSAFGRVSSRPDAPPEIINDESSGHPNQPKQSRRPSDATDPPSPQTPPPVADGTLWLTDLNRYNDMRFARTGDRCYNERHHFRLVPLEIIFRVVVTQRFNADGQSFRCGGRRLTTSPIAWNVIDAFSQLLPAHGSHCDHHRRRFESGSNTVGAVANDPPQDGHTMPPAAADVPRPMPQRDGVASVVMDQLKVGCTASLHRRQSGETGLPVRPGRGRFGRPVFGTLNEVLSNPDRNW